MHPKIPQTKDGKEFGSNQGQKSVPDPSQGIFKSYVEKKRYKK